METVDFAALKTATIAALTTTQLGALTSSQMIAMTTAQTAALGSAQVGALSTATLAALATDDLAALKTSSIAALSTTQLNALTTTQVTALTTAQLASLTTAQLAVLAPSTPLVLDLNGNGVQTLGVSSGVQFDIFATGKAVNTGWVGQGDGLLVMDRNNDGTINNGGELFGSSVTLADGSKAQDGYAALSELDSNGDRVIDSGDAAFDKLKVWVDGNADGVSQADELLSLKDAGVAKLNLNAAASDINSNGNWVGLTSTFEKADGSQVEHSHRFHVRGVREHVYHAGLVQHVTAQVHQHASVARQGGRAARNVHDAGRQQLRIGLLQLRQRQRQGHGAVARRVDQHAVELAERDQVFLGHLEQVARHEAGLVGHAVDHRVRQRALGQRGALQAFVDQRLGQHQQAAGRVDQRIDDLRVEVQRLVGGNRPGGGGPDD
eukprot:gene43126-53530_t